jgi:hypothetical protein
MIVVRLMGGMGNQMFQYAAARQLSHCIGAELRYDTSFIGRTAQGTARNFELPHFSCVGRPLSTFESLRFGSQYRAPLAQRLVARVVRGMRPHSFYEEPSISFDPSFQSLGNDTVIVGRFQSYLYFQRIADLLRKEFRNSQPLSSKCRSLCEEARVSRSVGLHVRRTDYVNNEVYRNVIQSLPLDYYDRALAHIWDVVGRDTHLYIVSDDISWCRQQSVFRHAHRFVDLSNSAYSHLEEFEVLRSCRHFVISNSTFAWWAAWLSDSQNKEVVGPREWSHNKQFDSPDRFPPGWTRL